MGSRRCKRRSISSRSQNSQAKGLPQTKPLERPLCEVAEGASPQIGSGQSLRHKYRGNQLNTDSPCLFWERSSSFSGNW